MTCCNISAEHLSTLTANKIWVLFGTKLIYITSLWAQRSLHYEHVTLLPYFCITLYIKYYHCIKRNIPLSLYRQVRTLHLPVHDQSSLSCTHFTPFSTFKSQFCCFNSLVNISFWCALHLWSTAKQYVLGSWNKLLHSMNRALWYTYMRMTNKMHTFLHNLFHLIYPRHVSNK